MSDDDSEFVFLFNDPLRADACAEAARALGYQARLLAGDGEGRHFQLRLRRPGTISAEQFDSTAAELRRVLAKHRGRFEGGSRSF